MPPIKIQLRHSLLSRLMISYILLASVPIVITGLVLMRTARQSIEQTIQHRNLEFAKRAAQNISEKLNQANKILKFNAENTLNLHMQRLAHEVIINNIVKEFDIFKEIYLLNLSGQMVISTHYVEDKDKYVDEDFISKLITGESYHSKVFISEDKLPFMELAEPIRMYNDVIGILFAKVNLKAMWDIMDSSVVGQRGEALMFDSNGSYIAHSMRKKIYLKEKFPDKDIVNEISRGRFGHKIYTDHNGVKIIAAYAAIPLEKWGVVIQQPIEEAFAPARTMRLQILIFVISSILIASFIAYIYTRRIVNPVNQLISGIKKFSTGDLKYRIPHLGKDEISTLAIQFNTMAVRLTEIQNKLKRIERFETLSKMASILSHEIRNPLNAMVINMQILKRELSKKTLDKAKVQNYYNILASEITRVERLVSDFLLLARPPQIEKKPVIIQHILSDIILEQQGVSKKHNVKIKQKFYSSPIEIFADENRLKQAFLNIYINALQSMPNGGTLTIAIYIDKERELYPEDRFVKITFNDTGAGISERELEHIFDFYYTTKKGGTGLGLAISQQIIEEHDGTIEAESKQGIGTTFTISLPSK